MNVRLRRWLGDDGLLILTILMPVFLEQVVSVILQTTLGIIRSNADTSFLAATSFVTTIDSVANALFLSIATGSSILMSNYFGAENKEKMRKLFSTSMTAGIAISSLCMVGFFLFPRELILLAYPNISELFLDTAVIYMRYSAIGFPPLFFVTCAMGYMRACQYNKSLFLVSTVTGVTQLVSDLLFVLFIPLGIHGVGIGILLAKVTGIAICVYILRKMDYFKGTVRKLRQMFEFKVMKDISRLGYVICLESLILCGASVALQSLVSRMDDISIVARSIVSNALSLFSIAANAFSLVALNLAGKFNGAGDRKHALSITLKLNTACMAVLGVISAVGYPLTPFVISLYTDDPAIQQSASQTLRVALLCMPLFFSSFNVLPAGLRGVGLVKFPLMVLAMSHWICQIPLVYYFCIVHSMGAVGYYYTVGITWCFATVIFYIVLAVQKRKADLHPQEHAAG